MSPRVCLLCIKAATPTTGVCGGKPARFVNGHSRMTSRIFSRCIFLIVMIRRTCYISFFTRISSKVMLFQSMKLRSSYAIVSTVKTIRVLTLSFKLTSPCLRRCRTLVVLMKLWTGSTLFRWRSLSTRLRAFDVFFRLGQWNRTSSLFITSTVISCKSRDRNTLPNSVILNIITKMHDIPFHA